MDNSKKVQLEIELNVNNSDVNGKLNDLKKNGIEVAVTPVLDENAMRQLRENIQEVQQKQTQPLKPQFDIENSRKPNELQFQKATEAKALEIKRLETTIDKLYDELGKLPENSTRSERLNIQSQIDELDDKLSILNSDYKKMLAILGNTQKGRGHLPFPTSLKRTVIIPTPLPVSGINYEEATSTETTKEHKEVEPQKKKHHSRNQKFRWKIPDELRKELQFDTDLQYIRRDYKDISQVLTDPNNLESEDWQKEHLKVSEHLKSEINKRTAEIIQSFIERAQKEVDLRIHFPNGGGEILYTDGTSYPIVSEKLIPNRPKEKKEKQNSTRKNHQVGSQFDPDLTAFLEREERFRTSIEKAFQFEFEDEDLRQFGKNVTDKLAELTKLAEEVKTRREEHESKKEKEQAKSLEDTEKKIKGAVDEIYNAVADIKSHDIKRLLKKIKMDEETLGDAERATEELRKLHSARDDANRVVGSFDKKAPKKARQKLQTSIENLSDKRETLVEKALKIQEEKKNSPSRMYRMLFGNRGGGGGGGIANFAMKPSAGKALGSISRLAGSALKALSALGPHGIAIATGLAVAFGGVAIAIAKMNERLKQAGELPKVFNNLNNDCKLLIERMKTLGYYNDDMVNQFIDLQVQAEKTAWANRFLTETDKELEEKFMNMRITLGTLTGVMGDIMTDQLNSLGELFGGLGSILYDLCEGVLKGFAESWFMIKDAMVAVGEICKPLMEKLEPVGNFLSKTFGYVGRAIGGLSLVGSGGIVKAFNPGYAVELEERVNNMFDKNEAQAREKEMPTVNFGPWQKLQTLLQGSRKASTESLTSAYDRINNAVANRNPVVDAINKQIAQEKAFQAETKGMNKSSEEYRRRVEQHNHSVETSLAEVTAMLRKNAPAIAAVVEG